MNSGELRSAPLDEALVSELIARVLAAFNAHDVDGFVGVMTEDVVFEHSLAPATLHRRAAVRAFYINSIWKAFPDLTLELTDGPFFHPSAPRASMRWLAAGTHAGPLDPPGLAATGKHVEFDVREIAEVRGGLASQIHLVIDVADAMRQLGVLPARGSRGERAFAGLQRLQMKLANATRHQ